MSKFFDETMQGLLEAVAIEKGEISLVQKENMPAPTFIASDKEKELIDELINLRKETTYHKASLQNVPETSSRRYPVSKKKSIAHLSSCSTAW